jgi:hypothetical protein
MLRVTKFEAAGRTNFKLEGKLAGCWVEVMEDCWKQALTEGAATPMTVDLNAITYVDGRGTDLLRQMHRQGVELSAGTCLGKGIVEQICSGEPVEHRHQR